MAEQAYGLGQQIAHYDGIAVGNPEWWISADTTSYSIGVAYPLDAAPAGARWRKVMPLARPSAALRTGLLKPSLLRSSD